MEHTKGPWRIERTVDRLYIHGTDNLGGPIDESTLVAQVGFFKTEANARLIAAAPELLNAVRFVLEYHADKQNEQTLDVLRKALNKAEGEEK